MIIYSGGSSEGVVPEGSGLVDPDDDTPLYAMSGDQEG